MSRKDFLIQLFEKSMLYQLLNMSTQTKDTPKRELSEEDLQQRRLKSCIAKWPDCERGHYHPKCCRFPKSCSPHAHIEAVWAGTVSESDLE